jgi:hypothetical protein
MSLRANHLAHHVANTGFPTTGGGGAKKTTGKKTTAKRVSAEQKAEQAQLNDPYGDHSGGKTQRGGRRTRVVRRRVRRRRVGSQQTQQSNYGSSKTQLAKNAKQAKAQAKSQGPSQSSNQHMTRRMNSQSNLNRMSAQFAGNQTGQTGGPKTPVGRKMAMLGNLQNYMKNDYAAMKANDQDNAFTYRTSEARQLVATLGSMVSSTTKQGKKKDTKGTKDDNKGLSSAAFGRQKGLLRRLKAMSDPTGQLPEGLPPDYKPFESVA